MHQLHVRWDIFLTLFLTDHRSGMTPLIYSITSQLSCLCVLERQVAKIRAVLRWKPVSREFDGICCMKKLTNICVLWNWSGHWMAKHSVGVAVCRVCPCEVTVSTGKIMAHMCVTRDRLQPTYKRLVLTDATQQQRWHGKAAFYETTQSDLTSCNVYSGSIHALAIVISYKVHQCARETQGWLRASLWLPGKRAVLYNLIYLSIYLFFYLYYLSVCLSINQSIHQSSYPILNWLKS